MADQPVTMLSIKQVALRACVCENVVRSWVSTGILSHYRVGCSGKANRCVNDTKRLSWR